jgi:hypothetical protein
LKYILNKYFYQLLYCMRTSGKKVAIETEKFQYLGEISSLTHFVYELEDQESTLSTEGLFSQIY